MSQPAAVPPRTGAPADAGASFGEGAMLDPDSDAAKEALAASAAGVAAELAGERPPADTTDEAGGTGGSSGSSGSGAGSGGGTGAIAPTPFILLGVAAPSGISASGVPSSSEAIERESRPERNFQEFNEGDKLAQALSDAASRGAPAVVIDMQLRPDGGVDSRNFPEHRVRTAWGGVMVGRDEASLNLLRAQRSWVNDFVAGFTANPVNPKDQTQGIRPAFRSTDGHEILQHVMRGAAAGEVRDPRLVALSKSNILLVAKSQKAKATEDFPDMIVEDFDDSLEGAALEGELLTARSRAQERAVGLEDRLAQQLTEQQEKLAELQQALTIQWQLRNELRRNWRGTPEQWAQWVELNGNIGRIVGLVELSKYVNGELDSAYYAAQWVTSNAATVSATGGEGTVVDVGEAVAAEAQDLATITEQAVAESIEHNVDMTVQADLTAPDWAADALNGPNPPQELIDALGGVELPSGWHIDNVDARAGTFELDFAPVVVDEAHGVDSTEGRAPSVVIDQEADVDPARSPDSTIDHDGLSPLDEVVTAESAEAQQAKVIDGSFDSLGVAPPEEEASTPISQPAAAHSATTMRLQPGDDGGGDEGGSGTAASAGKRRRRQGAGPMPEGVDAAQLVNGGNGDDSGEDHRSEAEDSTTEPGKKPAAATAEQLRQSHQRATGQAEVVDEVDGEGVQSEDDPAAQPVAVEAEVAEPESPRVELEPREPDERRDDDPANSAVEPATDERRDRTPADDSRDEPRAQEKTRATVEATEAEDEAPKDSDKGKPEQAAEAVAEDVSEVPAEDAKPGEPKAEDRPEQSPDDPERPTEDNAKQQEPVEGEAPPEQEAHPEGEAPAVDERAEQPQPEEGAAPAKNAPMASDGTPPADSTVPDPTAQPVESGPASNTRPPNQPIGGSTGPVSTGQPASAPAPVGTGQRAPHQPPGPPGVPARTAVPTRSPSHTGPKGAYGGGGPVGMSSSHASGAPRSSTPR